MTILEKCKSLQNNAIQYNKYKNDKDIKERLMEINETLSSYFKIFKSSILLYSILADKNCLFSKDNRIISSYLFTDADINKILKYLVSFKKRFEEENYKAKQGRDLGYLTKTIEAISSKINDNLDLNWESFVLDCKNSWENYSVSTLESRSSDPKINEYICEYKEIMCSFNSITITPPNSEELFEEIKETYHKIHALIEKIDWDLPDYMIEFFKGLQRNCLTLNNLDPTILKWLDENDDLGSYKIRRG